MIGSFTRPTEAPSQALNHLFYGHINNDKGCTLSMFVVVNGGDDITQLVLDLEAQKRKKINGLD